MNQEKTPKQLIVEKIKASQNILLLAHINPDGDAISSILALHHTLKKMGKNTTLAAPGKKNPLHRFLPDFDLVTDHIDATKEFIISLNTTGTKAPHKVKYQTEDDKIHLIITPAHGNFNIDDVSLQEGGHNFDLIITLDTPRFGRLDKIYLDNSELFTQTPIINIDHHTDNENFGEINYVNDKSSSTCEILIAIIESLSTEAPLLDQTIATCILAGILSDTASFQNPNTTSKSLTVAAQMIAAGADHQSIIKNLFKTQSLAQLRAWGKILTKLQTRPSLKLAWATISQAELTEMNATAEDVGGVLDSLVKNLPDTDVVFMLTQHPDHIKGSLRSHSPVNINPIATELGGGGHQQASGFELYETTLNEAEQRVLDVITKHLSPATHQPSSVNPSDNHEYINSETPSTTNPAVNPPDNHPLPNTPPTASN